MTTTGYSVPNELGFCCNSENWFDADQVCNCPNGSKEDEITKECGCDNDAEKNSIGYCCGDGAIMSLDNDC